MQQLSEVIEFMHSKDFNPPEALIPDGEVHRFQRNSQKKNAWYIGWQNPRIKDGSFYYVFEIGDWKTGEKHTFKPEKLTRPEKKLIDEQIKERQRKLKSENEKLHLETADLAEKRFTSALKVGSTPYMQRKLIPELYGCCIYSDRLQVPARDIDAKIWSMQSVFPNGEKLFMTGGRVKGCFHTLGEPIETATEINVTEGIATGATIFQATGKTTLVCFGHSNMVEVAKAVKAKYPDKLFCVYGDDDRNVEGNPGRTSATKAQLLLGGPLVFPTFREEDHELTDFNDLHVKYGIEAVKNQLQDTPVERTTGFIALGYDESTHFFYDIQSKDIVKIGNFVSQALYQIANREYWETRYPGVKTRVDWDEAAHDLIRQSRAVGPFDSSRVRGTGVWLDDGRIVVNTGHNLYVDSKETSLTGLKSWHIYVQTRNRLPGLHSNPLTAKEGRYITDACKGFKWKNEGDGFLLAGWLLVSRVAAALPVRPHIWITGGMGTGKSTLFESILKRLLGSDKGYLYLQGASTEAGIRQNMKASSIPIIFDEFESHDKDSAKRIDSVIELLRNSWSATSGKILKGSSSGVAVSYQLAFCACVSSIRPGLKNDADKSRFSVLELDPHGDDPAQRRRFVELLKKIDSEMGERLFARACLKIRELLTSFEIISQVLAAEVSQRYGQQTGMTLAGFWVLENDHVITEEEAKALVKDFICEIKEEVRNVETDHLSCMLHLVTTKVTLRRDRGENQQHIVEISIGDAIKHDFWREELRSLYGIRVDEEFFYVATNHTELKKIYRGTNWAADWATSLKRNIPGGKLAEKTSFGSKSNQWRSAKVPINLLP